MTFPSSYFSGSSGVTPVPLAYYSKDLATWDGALVNWDTQIENWHSKKSSFSVFLMYRHYKTLLVGAGFFCFSYFASAHDQKCSRLSSVILISHLSLNEDRPVILGKKLQDCRCSLKILKPDFLHHKRKLWSMKKHR